MKPKLDHNDIFLDPDYLPGTEYIFAENYENADQLMKDGDIVLIPQPSISPNDPLNWPKWRKFKNVAILMLLRGSTAAISNDMQAAVTGILTEFPQITMNNITASTAVLFAGIGGWSFLIAPTIYLYGARINYIICALLGIIGNAVFCRTDSTGMMYAGQFFVGAAAAAGEAVTLLSFSQMFYMHELIKLLGVYLICSSVGNYAGPIIDGYVAQDLGWRWVGYLSLIFMCACTFFVLFFLDETYFDRAHFATAIDLANDATVTEDTSSQPMKATSSIKDKEKQVSPEIAPTRSVLVSTATHRTVRSMAGESIAPQRSVAAGIRQSEQKITVPDEPNSYWKTLALVTPVANLDGWGFKQYAKRLVLVSRVLLFPPVVYSGMQWAMHIGFINIYAQVERFDWAGPPWNYDNGQQNLMNLPNLIGAVVGCLFASFVNPHFVRWIDRRNHGLHEAENTLWLMFVPTIVCPLGYFLFGVATKYHWVWPPAYIALGFVGFGFGSAGEMIISYTAECYPEMVLESMTGMVIVYCVFSVVISVYTDQWMAMGSFNAMMVAGALAFGVMILHVPFLLFGKRMRKLTKRMYMSFVYMRDSLAK